MLRNGQGALAQQGGEADSAMASETPCLQPLHNKRIRSPCQVACGTGPGLSDCKRQKALQPLPGLQFACNTTSLAMATQARAHQKMFPHPGEEETPSHSINVDAQSLQLRSSSPVRRAPSCFDPFHARCDTATKSGSKRLLPRDTLSSTFSAQQSAALACLSCLDAVDGPLSGLVQAPADVNTSANAPSSPLDVAIVQSFNTVATECPIAMTPSPRSLLTPRSNCSRPSAPSNAGLPTTFSLTPSSSRPACMVDDAGRSSSSTPTCKTPEQRQPCQQRGVEDVRLCAPYRTSPLPLRIEGIRRFACSNSSDEEDDEDGNDCCQRRHCHHNTASGASSLGEPATSYRLMPPPLLQRLSPPDRRSSDGGSSGAGRLVCNLVERFNNTQLYDALISSP
eukprot:jgi/Ulvmu1/11084/UM007_0266.1